MSLLSGQLSRLWRIPEVRLLASLGLISGLLAMFFELADEVMDGDTHTLDTALLLAFRTTDPADPIGPQWLEIMISDLTALGGITVLTLISTLSIIYLLIRGKSLSAGLIAFSGLGGLALNHILKTGFDRPRPDLVAHLVEVHSLSFPSAHAMLSAIVYLTLGALLSRSQPSLALKLFTLITSAVIAMSIGLSRIYLGVHWPTDVLAGWCIGVAWALAILRLHAYFMRRPRVVSHI